MVFEKSLPLFTFGNKGSDRINMKKIFFSVFCLAPFALSNVACAGQRANKATTATADATSDGTADEVQADSTGYIVRVGQMASENAKIQRLL